jgi:hypothetical protein
MEIPLTEILGRIFIIEYTHTPYAQKSHNPYLPAVSKTGTVFESSQIGQSCTNLDLRLGRLWEERRASAGGLSCREIFQSYLRVASPSLFLFHGKIRL